MVLALKFAAGWLTFVSILWWIAVCWINFLTLYRIYQARAHSRHISGPSPESVAWIAPDLVRGTPPPAPIWHVNQVLRQRKRKPKAGTDSEIFLEESEWMPTGYSLFAESDEEPMTKLYWETAVTPALAQELSDGATSDEPTSAWEPKDLGPPSLKALVISSPLTKDPDTGKEAKPLPSDVEECQACVTLWKERTEGAPNNFNLLSFLHTCDRNWQCQECGKLDRLNLFEIDDNLLCGTCAQCWRCAQNVVKLDCGYVQTERGLSCRNCDALVNTMLYLRRR